ncbi:MAG: OsmC family protein [Thiobacillus sp.]|uniref:OsmC family protein n=1 Tax=Thiobacillus sp. TaxID=924 RepID=UPI00168C92B3|nr:OsmC family protein [Thiobacillus sp.]QLQ02106.1 MAG: OsmC family protein [Thiobacillus sp.]
MAGSVIPFSLHGTGTGVLCSVSFQGSKHVLNIEGHPAFGGTESYLSPLDIVLASLLSCTQVTGKIVSTGMKGMKLGAWDVKLTSNLDNSVLVFGEQGVSNFRDVELTVSVENNLSDGDFEHFTSEIERRCPIATLFRASGVKYKMNWTSLRLPE